LFLHLESIASGVMENFNIFSRRFWSLVKYDWTAWHIHMVLSDRYVLVRGESGRYLIMQMLILLICGVREIFSDMEYTFVHQLSLTTATKPFDRL